MFPTNNLYYVMLYQGSLKHDAGLIYEKFYFDGTIRLPISKSIENLYAAFYLRFLLLQDNTTNDLNDLLNRSHFILQSIPFQPA